jgi:hypothetical protein
MLYVDLLSRNRVRMWGSSRPGKAEQRFQPRIGTEFEAWETHVIDARTRGFLSRAVIVGTCGALSVSGGYGLATGNYAAVEIVRAVTAPFVGAVMTHYFGSAGKDSR